jgi:ankyrin repeat protein
MLRQLIGQGNSALMSAIEKRNRHEIHVQMTKNVASTIDQKNKYGQTALHFAILYQEDEKLALLLLNNHQADGSIAAYDGTTPLMLACLKGFLSVATLLLNRFPALLDQVTKDSNVSALLLACEKGHESLVQLLLQHNASVMSDSNGISPLFFAAQEDHMRICEILLGYCKAKNIGGIVNRACPSTLATPLMMAARNGNHALCRLLLLYGADVNAATVDGTTALHLAVVYNRVGVVSLLLEPPPSNAGANEIIILNSKTSSGFTPLDIAKQKKFKEIIQVFQNTEQNIQQHHNQVILLQQQQSHQQHQQQIAMQLLTPPTNSPQPHAPKVYHVDESDGDYNHNRVRSGSAVPAMPPPPPPPQILIPHPHQQQQQQQQQQLSPSDRSSSPGVSSRSRNSSSTLSPVCSSAAAPAMPPPRPPPSPRGSGAFRPMS